MIRAEIRSLYTSQLISSKISKAPMSYSWLVGAFLIIFCNKILSFISEILKIHYFSKIPIVKDKTVL